MDKLVTLMEKWDPLVINSLFLISQLSSSTALALSLIFQDGLEEQSAFERLSLKDAVDIARVDEQFQQSKFGVVEGAHDFQKIDTLATFAGARSIL